MEPQSRNIVLCFDGTSNEVVSTPTNVLRMCRCLVKDARQIVYYQPGVGTLLDPYALTSVKKWVRKIWDLAAGFSLRDNVVAGYQFISHNYQPGDMVYVFGFSRGAYTARAVVGMLNMFGQLRPENENLIPYLWQCYRINIKARAGTLPDDRKLFENARKYMRLFSVPAAASAPIDAANPVPVEFVGVFDTVSSYLSVIPNLLGILGLCAFYWLGPVRSIGPIPLWPFIVVYGMLLIVAILFRWLPYTSDMPNAANVRHAVALDEYRAYFPSNHIAGVNPEHIEIWFSGVHTDVGGGRPQDKSQLSKVALRWMLGEAQPFGVRFDPQQVREELVDSSPLGERGRSMAWYWLLAGLVPQLRFTSRLTHGRESGLAREESSTVTPAAISAKKVNMIRWYWPNFWRYRYIRSHDRIHWSVAHRQANGLLKHPRLNGITWTELEKTMVSDKPIDGYTDPSATS